MKISMPPFKFDILTLKHPPTQYNEHKPNLKHTTKHWIMQYLITYLRHPSTQYNEQRPNLNISPLNTGLCSI